MQKTVTTECSAIIREKFSEIQKGNMTPYEGWRFIFDEAGVAHHVPDKPLLDEMVKLYYGENP